MNKLPKCKHCKERFVPRYNSTLQPYCMAKTDCIAAFMEMLRKDKEKKRKVRLRKMKQDSKTLSDHIQEAQRIFNSYIRERDKNEPCISCGTRKEVQYCAGHYYHAGGYAALRFNEDNVHKQCNKNCNLKLSGNILEYRPNLIKKIGQKRFDYLEAHKRDNLNMTIPEVIELKKLYRDKLKTLKNN